MGDSASSNKRPSTPSEVPTGLSVFQCPGVLCRLAYKKLHPLWGMSEGGKEYRETPLCSSCLFSISHRSLKTPSSLSSWNNMSWGNRWSVQTDLPCFAKWYQWAKHYYSFEYRLGFDYIGLCISWDVMCINRESHVCISQMLWLCTFTTTTTWWYWSGAWDSPFSGYSIVL